MIHFKTVFLVLFLPLFAVAQEGMTLDEYRYLTKGFAYQKEMGLDASKAGYQIIEKKSIDGVRLISLKKETLSTPQGFLFIISDKEKKDSYICLPNNNAQARVKELYQLDQQNITDLAIIAKFHQAVQHILFDTFLEDNKKMPITAVESQLSVKEPNAKSQIASEEQLTAKGTVPQDYEKSISVKEPQQNLEKTVNTNTQIQIGGSLDQRSLVSEPVVLGQHYKKGMVAVKICVDEFGKVTQAKYTQKGSTTLDKKLKKLAVNSAKKTIFVKSDRPKSCGTITYHFK